MKAGLERVVWPGRAPGLAVGPAPAGRSRPPTIVRPARPERDGGGPWTKFGVRAASSTHAPPFFPLSPWPSSSSLARRTPSARRPSLPPLRIPLNRRLGSRAIGPAEPAMCQGEPDPMRPGRPGSVRHPSAVRPDRPSGRISRRRPALPGPALPRPPRLGIRRSRESSYTVEPDRRTASVPRLGGSSAGSGQTFPGGVHRVAWWQPRWPTTRRIVPSSCLGG